MWITPPMDLDALPEEPGVYRMLDHRREVLYVGKARNLRRRVKSYFQRMPDSPRIQAMVRQVRAIECTITRSEAEALVLEHNLIKQLKPRYNVLLKDAKSYPYIQLTHGPFPRLRLYRGDRSEPGDYFGPFPHVRAVYETIHQLQRAFRLRDCSDTIFRHRSRPCLKHQIGRCSAPCVGLVDQAQYAKQVEEAKAFLRGENDALLMRWQKEMEQAAARLAFERAAVLRDRIRALRTILAAADAGDLPADADAFVVLRGPSDAHIAIGVRRSGRDLGSYTVRARRSAAADEAEILEQMFVERYRRETPPEVILVDAPDATLARLARVLRLLGAKTKPQRPQRGARAEWLARVRRSGETALAGRAGRDLAPAFEDLAEILGWDAPPESLAAVDNAHMGGKWTVAAVAWLDHEGPIKERYRHYRLDRAKVPGDDYAAMRELLMRLFRAIGEGEVPAPGLLCIDGGKGQLAVALEEAKKAGIELPMIGVAKGESRKVGEERLIIPGKEALKPGKRPGLLLIARVRDEAHRFAQRYLHKRMHRSTLVSALDAIPGVGPARRAALLKRFGGIEGVRRASREELAQTPGISKALAARIFDALHRS